MTSTRAHTHTRKHARMHARTNTHLPVKGHEPEYKNQPWKTAARQFLPEHLPRCVVEGHVQDNLPISLFRDALTASIVCIVLMCA